MLYASDWSLVIAISIVRMVTCVVACFSCQLHPAYLPFRSVEWGIASMPALKKGLGVCLATEKEFPYYPNCYFCHQVANWLVENRQKVMLTKKAYL